MNSVTDGNLLKIDESWSPPVRYFFTDEHASIIEQSRRRSINYGLKEGAEPAPNLAACEALLTERARLLRKHASPVMESLAAHIAGTHSMVALADADGVILHMLGDAGFIEKTSLVALGVGSAWSEQCKGTNAIGTAIVEKKPVWVHADEHYLHANRFLTSAAAPIFDCHGNVFGVLSVSGERCNLQQHTMALVSMSAQLITNQLFSCQSQDAITLHFGNRAEFIGTLVESIACFTPGGRFLTVNQQGLQQLKMPLSALQSHTFSSLFGQPLSALFEHHCAAKPEPIELCLPNGERIWARAQLRLAHGMPAPADGAATSITGACGGTSSERRRMLSLRYLNTGDPQVASMLGKVQKVIGSGIPILITGETGTGKELLAQAIHNDSPRAKGPFVAVNCASIPETLIESELFGYEDGAFTGARKKGSIGKIAQADGGTLFLDEIGDMPLSLQAHLLRVLQTRQVTPLGSVKSIPVDVELICATHRNLRELIAKGQFREDLYYRLNGLVAKLPPMRERTDLEAVISKILAALSKDMPCTVAPDVMQLFKRHRWPGNFRQLQSLLRIAAVMAGDTGEIRREHLPDDFLDELELPVPQPAGTRALPVPAIGSELIEVELSAIHKALETHGGNISAAARALGISRNTIYRKITLLKCARRLPESSASDATERLRTPGAGVPL